MATIHRGLQYGKEAGSFLEKNLVLQIFEKQGVKKWKQQHTKVQIR